MIIRVFDENRDIDNFLELYQICFGRPMSKECFEWKFLKNPFRMNIYPIIVVEEKDRIVGVRCDVFSRMMIKGTLIYATLGADSMVHPEFRGRGIQVKLVGIARDIYRNSQYKFHYTFPNNMSFNNLVRAGRRPICEVIRHWKVLNTQEVCNKMFHNPILQKAGVLLSPLLWSKTRVPKVGNQDVAVKEVSDVKILEEVYNRWKKPDKIYTVRDETYLNWRFKAHPEKEYLFISAIAGQEVKGYFIISMKGFMGMNIGTIVDYIVVDDDPSIFEPLLNYSLNLFKANNCALANTWVFTQKWAQQIVEDYGFLSSRRTLLRRWFPYSCLLSDPWEGQNFPYDLTSTEWYITLSDTDTN